MLRLWAQHGLPPVKSLDSISKEMKRIDIPKLWKIKPNLEVTEELARMAFEQSSGIMLQSLFVLGVRKRKALELAADISTPEATAAIAQVTFELMDET